VDEFVERFAPFATETSLVIPTASAVALGPEGRFVLRLKDRTPVMSGRCRVEDVKPVASGGHMVMHVRLLGLDEPSRDVHQRLLACKRSVPASPPKPPPLRVVRAPTPGGAPVPPPIGTAPTLIGTVAPSPPPPASTPSDELEKTMPSIKVPERQAPSAAFTLPANPLSELEAADLASFIECTLFEAEADSNAEPEAPADEAKTPRAIADLAAKPEAPGPAAAGADETEAIRAPTLGASQLRQRLMHAAPYALCTVIGVLAGTLLRSSPRPTTPVASPTPPVASTTLSRPDPVPGPTPVTATPEPAPPGAPAEPSAPAAAPPRASDCSASVTTDPPDATVLWGSRALGHTPLAGVGVPCGPASLVLRHERYKDLTRAVKVDPGRALVLSERLRRPNGTLSLASTPPRATFTVNGVALGPAPRKMSTWRFETVHVEATLPGYLPWKRTFYFKSEAMKVEAHLVAAKPEARARPLAAKASPGRR
jgi:hypothetical protein